MHPADPAYRGFPSFQAWAETRVATDLWDHSVHLLAERRAAADDDAFAKLAEQAARMASIDTGAVEGLYTVDRGFTMTVASMASGWEAEILRDKGPDVAALVHAQREAYDMALDAAISSVDIGEAWIRRLHEVICAPQDTYPVRTSIGPQQHPLPKGTYKTSPNHVELGDGSIHAYAPVQDTPAEMHRMVTELRSPPFQQAHPVLQASFVHYGFVCIHPFADGNGRVARALASVYTFRATSLPFVLFADRKDDYLGALRQADESGVQFFVDFVVSTVVDLQLLVAEQLRQAETPSFGDSLARIRRAVSSHGALTDAELDLLAQRVLEQVRTLLQSLFERVAMPPDVLRSVHGGSGGLEAMDGYRRVATQELVSYVLRTRPGTVQLEEAIYLLVTERSDVVFAFRVKRSGYPEFLDVRLADVHPTFTQAFNHRLATWVETVVQGSLARFAAQLDATRDRS